MVVDSAGSDFFILLLCSWLESWFLLVPAVKGWEQQCVGPSLLCFVTSGTILVSDDWRSEAKLTNPRFDRERGDFQGF